MTDMSMSPLALSGLGLITSVGYTVEAACAAIRCQLTRPCPVDGPLVWEPDAQEEVPLTGHPIKELTDGFQGVGRWFRLGRLAMLDLLRYTGLGTDDKTLWHQCGLIVCLPEFAPGRFSFSAEAAQALPQRLLRALALHIHPANALCLTTGHQGPLSALHLAWQRISSGVWHRAIVLSIDSLVDEASLRWLQEEGRLKTPENPVGLMPGEVAAGLLVEGRRRARGKVEAVLESCAFTDSPGKALSPIQHGLVLGDTVNEALAAGAQSGGIGDILGNLNGEVHRAMAWGTAHVRIQRRTLAANPRETWPAIALGDVGMASAAVALCLAVRSFVRGYSRNDGALIWSLADNGSASACVVRKPS